jgi:hypothetical protein
MRIAPLASSFFLIAFFLCLAGCAEKKKFEPVKLPETGILSEASNWGVVTSNFLRMRERPTQEAAVIMGITKGVVIKIVSAEGKKETIDGQTASWYRIDFNGATGWVFGGSIQLYSSKKEAEESALKIQ